MIEARTTLDGGSTITLDGSLLESSGSGITVQTNNCVIANLTIVNFPSDGIVFGENTAVDNVVRGCRIGTDGVAAMGNRRDGIRISRGAGSNLIGGSDPADRNIISGNGRHGVFLVKEVDVNRDPIDNVISGNYIGLNSDGTAAIGNGSSGVRIDAWVLRTTIGGLTEDAGNVISGNGQNGITFSGAGARRSQVVGNFIGTDATGISAIPNRYAGISLSGGAFEINIGGTGPGAGNVISGNEHEGLLIRDNGTVNNRIEGNLIGLNAAGTDVLGNGGRGIDVVFGAASNVIGSAIAGNFISGNAMEGIRFQGQGTNGNIVQGNTIGLNLDGVGLRGNTTGIIITQGASDNLIGGTGSGEGNIIAENGTDGIVIDGENSVGNSILGNSIRSNRSIGIRILNGGNAGVEAPTVDNLSPVQGAAPEGSITVELFADAGRQGELLVARLPVEGSAFADDLDLSAYEGMNLTATATDANGNTSEFSDPIPIPDLMAPLLELLGPSVLTVECGGRFQDPGVTAVDNTEGDLTEQIVVSGEVNILVPGDYAIEYSVTDSNGNVGTATRLVTVEDTTLPVITLSGSPSVSIPQGATFIDPGASAVDMCDGSLDAMIVVGGDEINTGLPGIYALTYTVVDSSGNVGTASRSVYVLEVAPPVITINGAAEILLECGESVFEDPGATAIDGVTEEPITTIIVGGDSVDTSAPGVYRVTYDAFSNDPTPIPASRVVRTVTVQDTLPPTITLNGPDTVAFECGEPIVDPGATAMDSCAGDVGVTRTILTDTDEVTTATILAPGTYTINYEAEDSNGNHAETVVRTVVVEDTKPPTLELIGPERITVLTAMDLDELGATATDDCDGDLTEQVVVGGGAIDLNIPGVYQVEFSVSDRSGNPALPISREIVVLQVINVDAAMAGSEDALGTEERPFGRIQDALNMAKDLFEENRDVEISLASGMYTETLEFTPNTRLMGSNPSNPADTIIEPEPSLLNETDAVILETSDGTEIMDLTVRAPRIPTGSDTTMVRVADRSVVLNNIVLDGQTPEAKVGIKILGAASSSSRLANCTIVNVSCGILAQDSAVNITRNHFRAISAEAIRIALPSANGSEPASVPVLGSLDDLEGTGANRFELSDAMYVVNESSETVLAEGNQWGTDDYDAILQRMSGSVDFTPFRLAANASILTVTISVLVQEADTSFPITTATIGLLPPAYRSVNENINGIYLFPAVPPADYTITATAANYQESSSTVEDPDLIEDVTINMERISGEGEGEGELPIELVAEQLLNAFVSSDTDRNGYLSLAESQSVVPSISSSQYSQLDTNHDGQLSREELGEPSGPTCFCSKSGIITWGSSMADLFLLGLTLLVLASLRHPYSQRQ
jgi:hypothetical protein